MTTRARARIELLALVALAFCLTATLSAIGTIALRSLQAGHFHSYSQAALAGCLGMTCVPVLLLAPLIAGLAGSERVGLAVRIAATMVLAVVVWSVSTPGVPWLSVLGLLALLSAVVAAGIFKLIPRALLLGQCRYPWAATSLALAFGGGFLLGWYIGLDHAESERWQWSKAGRLALIPAASAALLSLCLRGHRGDSIPLRAGLARPFIAGLRDTWHERLARNALLGVCVWSFLTATVALCLVRVQTDDNATVNWQDTFRFGVAVGGGIFVAFLSRNAYRFALLIPFSATVAAGCLLWLRYGSQSVWPTIGLGISLGAALPALLNCLWIWTTPKYHGVVAALLLAAGASGGIALAALVAAAPVSSADAMSFMRNAALIAAAVTALLAWLGFFRPAMEGTAEIMLLPIYRIRARGPGVVNLPTRGPCLVIGNHAAWFDPLFLAKILPAPTTPMMTSKFYDLPVLSWIMRRIVGTIRVPEQQYRHEAPELVEAVKALDHGACVVLFPEGYLRRREDQILKRFGRGVWKILADRPGTPIFACWLEGNWGSYFSHRNGPPTKGKRFDFWRRIDIGVIGPFTIDPAILGDHMATRTYLMQQVAAARAPLGLPALELAAVEGEKE